MDLKIKFVDKLHSFELFLVASTLINGQKSDMKCFSSAEVVVAIQPSYLDVLLVAFVVVLVDINILEVLRELAEVVVLNYIVEFSNHDYLRS